MGPTVGMIIVILKKLLMKKCAPVPNAHPPGAANTSEFPLMDFTTPPSSITSPVSPPHPLPPPPPVALQQYHQGQGLNA